MSTSGGPSEPEPVGYMPWTPTQLEGIARRLVQQATEGPKVDYKREILTDTAEAKAELLKDLCAIINTADGRYENFGFLLFGTSPGKIDGATRTTRDTDKLQNTVEQLIGSYLSPAFGVHAYAFEEENGDWWG